MAVVDEQVRVVRKVRPATKTQKHILHYWHVHATEGLSFALRASQNLNTRFSKEGRRTFFKVNKARTVATGILTNGQWPFFDFTNECPVEVQVRDFVEEEGKNLLYVLVFGEFPGTDAKKRDKRLIKAGKMPLEWM